MNEVLTYEALKAERDAQQKRADALAVENAGFKHALSVILEHVDVTDKGQAGVVAMIANDELFNSETPATDAALAANRETWRDDLAKGFSEAFRVLKPMGTLIFKWNETQIKTSEILVLTDQKPAFGHPSGKRANTHWIAFFKDSFSELEVRDASK